MDTKDHIITTAIRLFTERGYFNTSMRDISRVSELSTGAIYHHFTSKEEIAVEIFNRTTEFLLTKFQAAVAGAATTEERIRAVVLTMLQLADEQKELMEYALYVKHRDIIEQGRPICSSEPFEYLRDLMRKEMKSGGIRSMDVNTAAACLTSMPIRFMQLKCDGVLKGRLSAHGEEVFQCVWRALKA